MHVPFTNTKKHPVTVGNKRVYPNETRQVDQRDHPDYKPKRPAPEAPTDPVLELLDNSVKDIVPELPTLSEADFKRVWQGEIDGKSRSTLLEEFEEEQLRRAEIAEATGEGYDAFLEQLNATEDLAAALKAEQEGDNREPVVAAFEAEIKRRETEDDEQGE